MGQDIAEYGGAFKITQGFVEEFGRERVRNTPICESGIVGAAMGLSINGYKAVVEMQFADFVTCGFNQVINNLAKTHYRWGRKCGCGSPDAYRRRNWCRAIPLAKQRGLVYQNPGLKVVYPAFPSDAKGLLMAAIDDPNPVMYFEHKYLYRSISEEIPDDDYTIEIGKAKGSTGGHTSQHHHLWPWRALGIEYAKDIPIYPLRSLTCAACSPGIKKPLKQA